MLSSFPRRLRDKQPAHAWNLRSLFAIWGVVIPDQGGRLHELEQVGGRAHEAQFDFVWCGGSYRDDSTNAISRDAFHRRCWQLEVLQHSWN